jgi:hypothetical protein
MRRTQTSPIRFLDVISLSRPPSRHTRPGHLSLRELKSCGEVAIVHEEARRYAPCSLAGWIHIANRQETCIRFMDLSVTRRLTSRHWNAIRCFLLSFRANCFDVKKFPSKILSVAKGRPPSALFRPFLGHTWAGMSPALRQRPTDDVKR